MTENDAKQIGAIVALKAVGSGILIAQTIATFLAYENGFYKSFFWFLNFDYKLNLVIGLSSFAIFGNIFGRLAGFEIIIKKKDYTWVGIKYAFVILISTAFVSTLIGFFEEGLGKGNGFSDYILKPIFLISVVGIIPVLLVGFWFGWKINRKGKQ